MPSVSSALCPVRPHHRIPIRSGPGLPRRRGAAWVAPRCGDPDLRNGAAVRRAARTAGRTRLCRRRPRELRGARPDRAFRRDRAPRPEDGGRVLRTIRSGACPMRCRDPFSILDSGRPVSTLWRVRVVGTHALEQRQRVPRERGAGIGVAGDHAEAIAMSGPAVPAGRFRGQRSHRSCGWRRNSEISSAPATTRIGARARAAVDRREPRGLRRVELQIAVDERQRHRREIAHAGNRNRRGDRIPPEGSARRTARPAATRTRREAPPCAAPGCA